MCLTVCTCILVKSGNHYSLSILALGLCEIWKLITCFLPVDHVLVFSHSRFSPSCTPFRLPSLLPISAFLRLLPSFLSPFSPLLALSTFLSLGLIFCHLGVKDPRSFVVMCHRLRLAKEVGMTSTIVLDMEKVSRTQEIQERKENEAVERRKERRKEGEGMNEDLNDDIICV